MRTLRALRRLRAVTLARTGACPVDDEVVLELCRPVSPWDDDDAYADNGGGRAPRAAWTHVTLSDARATLSDAAVAAVAQASGAALRALSLPAARAVTDAGLVTLAAWCPNLETLALPGCAALTDTGVDALARRCPRLEHLNRPAAPSFLPAFFFSIP